MSAPTQEQIAKAKERAKQAVARAQALEARANHEVRKLDTRRKIILGGLLLDAADKDEKFHQVVGELVGRISRDQDRKVFGGWSLPSAKTLPLTQAQPEPSYPEKFQTEGDHEQQSN